jgi:AraC family transcriptional regulator, transcriptional activator of pobA
MTDEEKVILEEYRKAFGRSKSKSEIVDLNKKHTIKFDWVILRLSEMISVLGYTAPPFRHAKFTIVYVVKGQGDKTIGALNVPLKGRTLMIIPAQTLSSALYDENVRGYHLSFNLDFFLQEHFPRYRLLHLNLFKQNVIPFAYLNSATGKQLSQVFEYILEEKEQHRKNKQELILLKILEMILICDRQLKTESEQGKSYNPPLMVRYMELIQQHYATQHSTSYYAKMLHIHPNSLNAVSKRYMGQSAKALIASKLFSEAKYLIQLTTLSVKETAYELGFQSPSNFFRFFKRYSGYSPAAFRGKYLKR